MVDTNRKSRISVNVLANSISQFYSVFIGIAVFPVLLTNLGPEGFGLIGFFSMLSTWLMLLDVGLSQTISRESARSGGSLTNQNEFKVVLRSVELIFVCISAVVSIFVLMCSELIAKKWLNLSELSANDVQYCVMLMGVMFSSRWLIALYRGGLNGFERQVWVSGFTILGSTARFVGGLLLVVYFTKDVRAYFTYQLFIFSLELIIINRKIYSLLPLNSKFLKPSIQKIKSIAPFALGVAFTSGFWIIISQLDKVLLSTLLTLREYGFFILVATVSTGILMISAPIGTAIRPRLTRLIAEKHIEKMAKLYTNATHAVGVLGFPVIAVLVNSPSAVLYAWTGSNEAAEWGGQVLRWYALANGILLVLSFQYYLQFAFGNLKYHVRGNLIFGVFQIICISCAALSYGAIGTAVAWFALQLFFFTFWPAYIHSKFVPGLNSIWLRKGIFFPLGTTILGGGALYFIKIDYAAANQLATAVWLIISWCALSCFNVAASPIARNAIKKLFFNR